MTIDGAVGTSGRDMAVRWMLVPALCAGLFTMLALDPPTGLPSGALWVQQVANAAPGRLLLRVEWRAPEESQRVPGGPRSVALRDPTGLLLGEALVSDTQEPWVSLEGPPGLRGTLAVALPGETLTVPVGLPREPSRGVAPQEELLQVEGRALMPEVPTRVRVRTPEARRVRLVTDGDALQVTPSEAAPGACGVVTFLATPVGFDAPVAVELDGVTVHRSRLRVSPGALGLGLSDTHAVVSAALPPAQVFVAAGTEDGSTWWGVVPWPRTDTTLSFPLPPEAGWVSVARSADLADATTLWTVPGPGAPPCATTPDARRWWANLRPSPRPLQRVTVFDGPQRARQRARRAARQVRAVCALGLVLSLGFELSLVLSALRGRLPEALRPAEFSRAERFGRVAAGIGLLLLAALALSSNFILRTVLER